MFAARLSHSQLLGGRAAAAMAGRCSSDMAAFRRLVDKAQHVLVLTGAGISAESGVPTFRGAGGFWRRYEATSLASPTAFRANPSLVWEFYHYRRELVREKQPNPAHVALAEFERRCAGAGRSCAVVTQNVDDLHKRAGSENILQLHGSLFKVRCTECGETSDNHDSPICEALRGRGAPDPDADSAPIDVKLLPRCDRCAGLLRPAIVWFGENLDYAVMGAAQQHMDQCDLCLVVGTSSVVYPAAMFAPQVADRGVPVAEFNLDATPATGRFQYHFSGPAGTTVPQALAQ